MNMKLLIVIILLSPLLSRAETSTCFGTTSNGSLSNGVKLPSAGKNYVSYSRTASLAGRTYVHSTVRDIIVSAYKDLETEQPQKVYKYAETGFKEGGTFKPHKTHKNGLSVDFTTPVKNKNEKSVHLPTNPWNKFGYNIEFDTNDHFKGMYIDYDAMAAHIVALHKQAKKHGHDLRRVIFDPKLQPNLYRTQYAEYLKEHVQFSTKRSWVRHDEHYHVDFDVPCKQ